MQEQWFTVASKTFEVQNRFHEIWFSHGGPKAAALFGKRRARMTDFYFNPAAATLAPELLQEFNAQPCAPPEKKGGPGDIIGLSLLVGDQSILES